MVERLVQDDDQVRCLHDLEWMCVGVETRDACRKAMRQRIVSHEIRAALFVERCGPRLQRDLLGFQVLHDVDHVSWRHDVFDAAPAAFWIRRAISIFRKDQACRTDVRGAGAEKFGFPSGVRGIPFVGCSIH